MTDALQKERKNCSVDTRSVLFFAESVISSLKSRARKTVPIILSVCLFKAVFVPLAKAADWRLESSPVRLSVTSRIKQEHTARIDLPVELRKLAEYAAVFADHVSGALPLRPVKIAGEVAALEVVLPEKSSESDRYYVYFPLDPEEKIKIKTARTDLGAADPDELESETAVDPEPDPDGHEENGDEEKEVKSPEESCFRPVSLHYEERNLVARPFRFARAFAFDGNQQPLPFAGGLGSMADPVPVRKGGRRDLTVYRYRRETLVAIDDFRRIRFAVDSRDAAWFFYLDHKPVFSWKEYAKEKNGLLISDWLEIGPGLSSLTLQVWQRSGEETPGLLWAVDNVADRSDWEEGFAPVDKDILHSPVGVAEIMVEHQDNEFAGGFALVPGERFIYPAGQCRFQTWSVRRIKQKDYDGRMVLRLDERRVERDGRMLLEKTPSELTVRFYDPAGNKKESRYTFPVYASWLRPISVEADLTLREIPRLLDFGERLEISGSFGNLPDRLMTIAENRLKLIWRFVSEDVLLDEGELKLPVDDGDGDFYLQLPLLPAADGEIIVSLYLGDLSLDSEFSVRMIEPGRLPAEIDVYGRHLLAEGDPAVLLVKKGEDFPVESGKATDRALEQGIVVDDFWATRLGPGADVRLAEELNERSAVFFRHLHPGSRTHSGNFRTDLLSFTLLPEALEDPADIVVWAVGAPFLRRQADLPELLKKLRFLLNATFAQNKIPVLVTFPPMPGLDRDLLRKSAIEIKQMGIDYRVPVLDLYSLAMVQFGDHDRVIKNFFQVEHPAVSLRQPNNQGRQWFAQVTAELLKGIVNEN